jgi:hypothetical protein
MPETVTSDGGLFGLAGQLVDDDIPSSPFLKRAARKIGAVPIDAIGSGLIKAI